MSKFVPGAGSTGLCPSDFDLEALPKISPGQVKPTRSVLLEVLGVPLGDGSPAVRSDLLGHGGDEDGEAQGELHLMLLGRAVCTVEDAAPPAIGNPESGHPGDLDDSNAQQRMSCHCLSPERHGDR